MSRVDAARWALEQAELSRKRRNRQRDINPFDGDADGTFESARPMLPSRGGFGAGSLGTVSLPPGLLPGSHTIALYAQDQTFNPAGTPIVWAGKRASWRHHGFFQQTLPNSVLTVEILRYWRLDLGFTWDTWVKGGWVEVLINGTPQWTSTMLTDMWGWKVGPTSLDLGVVPVGTTVQVVVSPGPAASSGQLATGIFGSLVAVDPIGGDTLLASEPPGVPGSGEWLPYDLDRQNGATSATAGVTTTLLDGLTAGDLLVAAVHWISKSSNSVDATLTNQTGWSEVWRSPVPTSEWGSSMAVMVRRADATDVSPGRSYSWTVTSAGTAALEASALLFRVGQAAAGSDGFPFTVRSAFHRGYNSPPLEVTTEGPWAAAIGMAHRAAATTASAAPLWTPDSLPAPLQPAISGKPLVITDARRGLFSVRTTAARTLSVQWISSGNGTNGNALVVLDRNA
jgi:hypothetical protein